MVLDLGERISLARAISHLILVALLLVQGHAFLRLDSIERLYDFLCL